MVLLVKGARDLTTRETNFLQEIWLDLQTYQRKGKPNYKQKTFTRSFAKKKIKTKTKYVSINQKKQKVNDMIETEKQYHNALMHKANKKDELQDKILKFEKKV